MADNHRKHLQRSILAEVLPLDMPFVVHIDVSSACNFSCKFCFHSLSDKKLHDLGFVPSIMNMDIFAKAIEKISKFPRPLHRLCLIRHGESLLNKNLENMIRYAKKSGVATKVNISTNGLLFTPRIIDTLVDAGLDEVLVSIEALSSKDYKDICGTDVNFDTLVENITYFHKHRRNCRLDTKIVDCSLKEGDAQRFHEIFDPICDTASIEYIVPCFRGVDYTAVNANTAVNIMGDPFEEIDVCPQSFFQMHIFPNGNISICNADYNEKLIFGNVATDSLVDIWNGPDLNEFRAMHLEHRRHEHEYCSYCASNVCYTSVSDILDHSTERLVPLFTQHRS